jgi:hypothetical protein
MTTDDVFERIDTAWNELVELVRGIPGAALNAPDADGWALKDHLVHIAPWEQSLQVRLEGRDRDDAMGIGYVETAPSSTTYGPLFGAAQGALESRPDRGSRRPWTKPRVGASDTMRCIRALSRRPDAGRRNRQIAVTRLLCPKCCAFQWPTRAARGLQDGFDASLS